ncbi:MAG: rolling circle replication-associated protein, partial [Nitrospiraceae bacterium]
YGYIYGYSARGQMNMNMNEQRTSRHLQSDGHGAAADAPGGARHRRTAAGPPAAPKLVRRTFLGDHTESNASTQLSGGSTWSVKIHDFGKQWIESSWGKVDQHPGKRGFKGKSPNKEQNDKRARARATGEIRRKCLSMGADHLVTLTYRDNVEDRERVLTDLERLRRMLSRGGYLMPYVAVLECQKRGAIHPHLAVRGFQDIRLLRRCWCKIVGKSQGHVNVKGLRPGTSPVKLARYLSKYISKDIDRQPREFEEHWYFCSLGIAVPTERFKIVLTCHARDAEAKLFFLMFNDTLRRVGDYCTIKHCIRGAGMFG